MRATFSPAIARICSPAVRSVVSISANAVDSHAASDRPDRFLNPSTAIDRRAGTVAAAVDRSDGELPRARRNDAARTTPTTAINAIAATAIHIDRDAGGSNVPVAIVANAGVLSASTISAALFHRSDGFLARHFVTTLTSEAGT